jgi:peptidoglycan endopeptidase LytE
MTSLISYAKTQLGKPYIWGGQNPHVGFDCSGFIQWIYLSIGLKFQGDLSSGGLYAYFKTHGAEIFKPRIGALLFFGNTAIDHVALAISDFQLIEAAGGDHTTLTKEDAAKKTDACVRIRPMDYRKNPLHIVIPDYPSWVMNGA